MASKKEDWYKVARISDHGIAEYITKGQTEMTKISINFH